MAGVGQKYGITGSQGAGWTFTGSVVSGSGGVWTLDPGTAAAPALTFTADPDTGFFRTSANVLGVAAGGSSVGTFSSTGFTGAVNGTVGAVTPASGSFTTIAASGVTTLPVGAVGTPSLIFSGDTNTGLYWIGADSFGLAANGVVQATITTAGINGVIGGTTAAAGSFTTVTSTSRVSVADGTVGAPSVTFSSDTDTGLYWIGANSFGLAANGVVQCTITTGGINGVIGATTAAAGSFTTVAASSTLTVTGNSFLRGRTVLAQAAPAAKTVTAAISAAELVAGLITTTGATAPSVHQLPTGTLIDAEIPGIATGDSFDFYVINTGVGAADDATITVNTDVTIVGNPTVGALTDATIISGSGHFRARRSAANTYIVYRLS